MDLRTGEDRDLDIYAYDFDVLPNGSLVVIGYNNSPDANGNFLNLVDSSGLVHELVAPSSNCCSFAASATDGTIAYTDATGLVLAGLDGTVLTRRPLPAADQYIMGWTGDGWIMLGDQHGVTLFSPYTGQS